MTDQLPAHPIQGSVRTEQGRWSLRMERDIPHTPEMVWAALTKADQVRRWAPYAPARDLDVVGEVLLPQAEGGEPAEGSAEPGEVLQADRPRLLVLLWGGHIVRYELTPTSPGQVHLVLTHIFDEREEAPDYASGWHLCLSALIARLDGQDVPPVAGSAARDHGWEALRDDYAELLS
jgi:uncharacterized protein YndB with AHSA1/START domain